MNYSNAFGIEFRNTRETTHEGTAARSVSGSRHYDTQADDLWDALPIRNVFRAGSFLLAAIFVLADGINLKIMQAVRSRDATPPVRLMLLGNVEIIRVGSWSDLYQRMTV